MSFCGISASLEFKTLWPGLKNALFTRTAEKIFSTSDNHFPDSLIFFPLGKGIEWTPKTAVNLKIGAMAGEGALKLKSKHFIKKIAVAFCDTVFTTVLFLGKFFGEAWFILMYISTELFIIFYNIGEGGGGCC